LYEVAEYDLGKINLYEISFSGNGKLFCRLERPPSSQGSTQLILGSEQENIIDIWPTVVAQMQAHLMQAQMQAHPLTAFDFGGREEVNFFAFHFFEIFSVSTNGVISTKFPYRKFSGFITSNKNTRTYLCSARRAISFNAKIFSFNHINF
jgi:hypothetical protein